MIDTDITTSATDPAALIEALRVENEKLKSDLKQRTLERDHYKSQLDAKVRALFEARSEARKGLVARGLFDEAEAQAEPIADQPADTQQKTEVVTVTVAAHAKRKPGRKPLDPKLPREVVRIELPESERVCAHDGSALVEIDVEVSEQLDIVPARITVLRTERVKYACPCCDQSIKVAKPNPALVPKSLFTPNLLAWCITAKYQDALPLYRQANILARCGGDIARNTLATAVVRAGLALQPIINLLQELLLAAAVLHIDETVIQVLKELGRKAENKSYFWVRATGSGPPIRLFNYAPSRSGKTALELLEGAKGAVMTDGYEPYNATTRALGLTHLGCWVHARRGFIEAEAAVPKADRDSEHPATKMIALIGELHAVETKATENQLDPSQRRDFRQQHSIPILSRIRAEMETLTPKTLPQSPLGKALYYLNHQWPKLIRFTENGNWPLHNNLAENAIRPFVVGRKNWMFADTVHGAQASANLYSLIETAKANGLEPYRYLVHLFKELPKAKNFDDIEPMLPWNVKLD